MVPEPQIHGATTVAVAITGISCPMFRHKGTGLLDQGPQYAV
jgi:hypothetical protein